MSFFAPQPSDSESSESESDAPLSQKPADPPKLPSSDPTDDTNTMNKETIPGATDNRLKENEEEESSSESDADAIPNTPFSNNSPNTAAEGQTGEPVDQSDENKTNNESSNVHNFLGGTSSSSEMEVADSSPEPNVPLNISQTAVSNNMNPPPISNNVEQSTTSDTVEQPTASDNVEPPPNSENVDKSTTSDTVEQPTASDNVGPPPNSDNVDKSTTSDTVEQPTASDNSESNSNSQHLNKDPNANFKPIQSTQSTEDSPVPALSLAVDNIDISLSPLPLDDGAPGGIFLYCQVHFFLLFFVLFVFVMQIYDFRVVLKGTVFGF